MNWKFPVPFWKQLVGEELTFEDLEGLDAYSHQALSLMKKLGDELTAEEFNAQMEEETFTTSLTDGTLVDLCPGGKALAVTHENYEKYIDLVLKARFTECKEQMEWVKEGVNFVAPMSTFLFLNWEEVQMRACGPPDIKAEELKKVTITNMSNDDPNIVMFWKMFDDFTQLERQKYLKFAWGRSKLPSDLTELAYQHNIQVYDYKDPGALPEAHTCFFTVDIPVYVNLETMAKKFRTAIELCGEIDADYDAGGEVIGDEEGENHGNEEEGGEE